MKDWNINVSLFTGIENNMSICYKFQNDFNDYFQDKNNKNINDYKSIFVSVKNKDKMIRILIIFLNIKIWILIRILMILLMILLWIFLQIWEII